MFEKYDVAHAPARLFLKKIVKLGVFSKADSIFVLWSKRLSYCLRYPLIYFGLMMRKYAIRMV